MEGRCEVATLRPGVYNATTSPAYTDGEKTFVVGGDGDDGDACPDVTTGGSVLRNYELETINFQCLDSSLPKDGYLE